MHIEKKDNYTVITPKTSADQSFFEAFSLQKEKLGKEHVILDFSDNFNITLQDILLYLNIAIDARKNGTSFVIICTGVHIDEIPDEISLVPTLNEAEDILQMDEIERDLMNF